MGFSVNNLYTANIISANYNRYMQPNNIKFGNSELKEDKFEANPLKKYCSEFTLKKAIKENPEISKILTEINAPVKINETTLKNLQANHAEDTKKIAKGILENLPFALKLKADATAIEKAAYLHDIGKILIPDNILNKTGKLSQKETEIMHRHSELSYELLKNSGLDTKTLNLIKNHHQNVKRTGYPFVDNTFFADINQQIVSVADKFSALTEKRAYKAPLTHKDALTLIYKDVKEGNLNPLIFNALVNYANKNATQNTSLV